VNSLVVVNGDQWRNSEFTSLVTRTNELHPHFVVMFTPSHLHWTNTQEFAFDSQDSNS
jgi:hypothetical protein